MNIQILSGSEIMPPAHFEVVERKGIGHPDTLADLVAETASNIYSRVCLDEMGVIPPHWFDKVLIAGASTHVTFGAHRVVLPIRAFMFGKMTMTVGKQRVDAMGVFREAVHTVFKKVFPNTTILDHVVCETYVHDGSGPDHPSTFYAPTSVNDVETITSGLRANDTSVVTAYAGYSHTEMVAIELENYLNSPTFKEAYSETGTDIKVMTVREEDHITITACIPFIGKDTPTLSFYRLRLAEIRESILAMARKLFPRYEYSLFLNTKDQGEHAYLTAFGTSLDKGDCGVVGRGNRYNGLITPHRRMSIEAAAGKNPTHHVGKLYSEVSTRIARDIFLKHALDNAITIVSHNGDNLQSPHHVFVECIKEAPQNTQLTEIVRQHLQNMPCMEHEIIRSNPVDEHASKPRKMYPNT